MSSSGVASPFATIRINAFSSASVAALSANIWMTGSVPLLCCGGAATGVDVDCPFVAPAFDISASFGRGEGCGVSCDIGFGCCTGTGGGGGIVPFGGPYCIIGRCCVGYCWGVTGMTGRFGSLIAYMVASNTCGSQVIVHVPNFVIVSLPGLFVTSGAPFFFVTFVQYRSNMPSLIHACRDLLSDSAKTPLGMCQNVQFSTTMQRSYLSETL